MFRRRNNYSFYTGMSIGELEKSRCQTAWMGPIPANTSEKQVLDFFRNFNPLGCNIVRRDNTTFCFIRFSCERDRANAIGAKGKCTFNGMQTVVNRSFNAYEGPRIGGKEKVDFNGRVVRY